MIITISLVNTHHLMQIKIKEIVLFVCDELLGFIPLKAFVYNIQQC